jgi:hypothetical protein
MKKKPNAQDEPVIRRLILEKLVMGKNWNQNHIEEDKVPKGLPKRFQTPWYHYVKHELAHDRLLVTFREHGKDLYGLNPSRKSEIETLVGIEV